MSSLTLSGISKRYGDMAVVDGLDLSVASGEFVSLLGPSGCGKTTLLRIIAGLNDCDTGTVKVGDADVTTLPAHKRNIGVVFQSYALFPHLTVSENIAFGLKAHRVAKDEIGTQVRKALMAVQLTAQADRPISALSGGQQQRVAVARAIATKPRLILLDEPLSALDRKLRETMQIELRQMLRDAGMTAIFVTHDQEEALVMSDRIAVMNRGRIEQLDVPEAIYSRPRTPFALNFVGLSSQWNGVVKHESSGMSVVETAAGTITAPSTAIPVGTKVLVGVRPEMIRIDTGNHAEGGGFNRLELEIIDTVYLGSRRLVYFQNPEPNLPPVMAELPAHADAAPRAGEKMVLSWPVSETLVFNANGAA